MFPGVAEADVDDSRLSHSILGSSCIVRLSMQQDFPNQVVVED